MIECPYCLAQLDPAVSACRFCGRNLAGQMQTLRRIAAMQSAFAQIQTEVAELQARLSQSATEPAKELVITHKHWRPNLSSSFVIFLKLAIVPDVLLLFAHHLFVFTLNLSPAWL